MLPQHGFESWIDPSTNRTSSGEKVLEYVQHIARSNASYFIVVFPSANLLYCIPNQQEHGPLARSIPRSARSVAPSIATAKFRVPVRPSHVRTARATPKLSSISRVQAAGGNVCRCRRTPVPTARADKGTHLPCLLASESPHLATCSYAHEGAGASSDLFPRARWRRLNGGHAVG